MTLVHHSRVCRAGTPFCQESKMDSEDEYDDEIDLKTRVRTVLGQFVLAASSQIDDAYHFSVRGNNEMSFSSFTMLTEDIYAATLIAGELVGLENRKDGLRVTSSKNRWDKAPNQMNTTTLVQREGASR